MSRPGKQHWEHQSQKVRPVSWDCMAPGRQEKGVLVPVKGSWKLLNSMLACFGWVNLKIK